MLKNLLCCGVVALTLAGIAAAAETTVTAPNAQVEKLSGDFKFTEGPTSDAEGNVYFTDQPNDRIMKWTVDGKLETFMEHAGRSNGMCIDAKGKLWSCADEKNELWCIDLKTKQHEVVIKDFEGKLLNGPNDLWCDRKGGIYLTDPMYKRPWWPKDRTMQQKGQVVLYLAPDHKTLTPVATDLKQPNGIIGTPDGKTLYVADIGAKKTYRFDIGDDGKLSNKKLFCEMGSDGLTIDHEGNIYLTGNGVTVFNRGGEKIQQIDMPEKAWTANVCFGGKEKKKLFITSSKNLYSIDMRVQGVDAQ